MGPSPRSSPPQDPPPDPRGTDARQAQTECSAFGMWPQAPAGNTGAELGARRHEHKDPKRHDFWHFPSLGCKNQNVTMFMWSLGPLQANSKRARATYPGTPLLFVIAYMRCCKWHSFFTILPSRAAFKSGQVHKHT